jgi:hypothetical protein
VSAVASLSASAAAACAQLVLGLPEEIAAGVARRDTSPVSTSTGAWGDPPITLRCGTAEGSPRDDPYVFDEITWAMHDSGASRTWTTRGRSVNVEVVIPDGYDGQAEMLGRLAGVIAPL